MHDALYENQKRLGRRGSAAPTRSRSASIVDAFDRELAGHIHAARVQEDFMSGVRSGVNGTPTFYVNGARYDDSYDLDTLLGALEAAASR